MGLTAEVPQNDLAVDPTASATGIEGWQIWPKFGRFFANDDSMLSDGTHTGSW